jgi:PilZ domain
MEDRRRAPRQSAVWMGTCCVDGDGAEIWRDCGVFDFSTLGIGMDFRPGDSSDLMGRRITMRLPVGGSMDITLVGEVRNVRAGPDGVVRTGIEFLGLTEDELYIVDLLEVGSLSTAGASASA